MPLNGPLYPRELKGPLDKLYKFGWNLADLSLVKPQNRWLYEAQISSYQSDCI